MLEEESVKSNDNNTPRTIFVTLLDYKEKGEIMQRHYELKDTTYSVRKEFSKETVEIGKMIWDQVKKLPEDENYTVTKYSNIVRRDF